MKTFILSALLAFTTLAAAAFDHSHAKFTKVLNKYVKGNNVEYAALAKSPEHLGSYLVDLSKINKSEYSGWNENEQKAYLINLYNAATLKLIVDNYPLKSIKDIPSPWKQETIKALGQTFSLDEIEHDILRKDFDDARIHFGVNCASIGCPPLLDEAFTAKKLDSQLDKQARAFLADSSKNKFDIANGTLYLSPIFDWFKEDFTKKAGDVESYITPYLSPELQKQMKGKSFRIKNSAYDWSLNEA